MKTKTKVVSKNTTSIIKDVRDEIKNMLERVEETWFELSQKLCKVYYEENFKSWGFETFKDYVEQELHLNYRIALWRVNIGKTILNCNIVKEQVAGLGWTKFNEISSLLTEDTNEKLANAILKKAQTMTFKELQEYVKKTRTETIGGTVIKKTKLSFKLTEEQANVIENAIEIAMKMTESTNQSIGLEYIAIFFLANHGDMAIPAMVKKAIEHYQEDTKVKPKKYANKKE